MPRDANTSDKRQMRATKRMGTYDNLLNRWAVRWHNDVTSEIKRHDKSILNLRKSLVSATEEDKKEYLNSLIKYHEDLIGSIRRTHRKWQRLARKKWKVD